MIAKKRILVISPFENWPLSQGTIVRTHHFVRHLLRMNQVWFAYRRSPDGGEDGLPVSGRIENASNRFLQLFNPLFLFELWWLSRREQLDLLVVSQAWSGIHGVLLHLLTGKPLLVDTHNVEFLRFRRMGHWTWPLVRLCERLIYRFAYQVICVSDTDRRHLIEDLRVPEGTIRVVPNGADIHSIRDHPVHPRAVEQRLGLPSHARFLLFFGSLRHVPNAQAATIIVEELLPRLQQAGISAPVVIAGPGQQQFLAARQVPPQVHFVGFVDDIVSVIKSAHLVIVPLTSGSGTRFKIIEAVACGRPVISTTIGAEGLAREAFGSFLTIRDEWDAFADAVEELLAVNWDRPIPTSFVNRYDWQTIFSRFETEVGQGQQRTAHRQIE